MYDLEITWSGGQLRFSPDDSPVLIGRSSSAAVVVPQGTVSRRHLVMNWNGTSWEAEDTSTHGSFDPIGVRLATTWTVGNDVLVRLGSPRGAELSMRLTAQPVDLGPPADPYADPDSPPTIVDFGPPPPPDQSPDGSGLLHVPDDSIPSHQPQHAPAEPEPIGLLGESQSPEHGHEAVSFEPEPIGILDDNPHIEREAVAFGQPDLSVAGDDVDFRQPAEANEFVADPPSFHPEPVDFQTQGETSVLEADSVGSQQTLVDPVNGPMVDTAKAGQIAFERAGTESPSVDLTADDPVTNLGGVVDYQRPSYDSTSYDYPGDPVSDHDLQPSNLHDPDQRYAAPVLGEPGPDHSSPAATFVESDTLRLQIDGEDFVFLPGHEVTVGRDPHCTVTVDERHSLVSRRHLRFVHAEGSWWLEDASSKGTYVDGRRLNRPYKSEGAFIAHLGDGAAGTQLRVVTSGQHRQPTNRAGLAIAAVAAAALVLAALVAGFVFGGNGNEAEALSTAKKSTVMLLSESGHGSGFFVSESLIVTNQHVAAMADQLVVAVSPEEDEPAEIRYVAKLVENHPFLDVAVVEITNQADFNDQGTVTIGEVVDSADVPILQLGDSSAVIIGDPVTSTGFPGRFSVSSSDDAGQLRLAPVSTTRGQAANFTSWPSCSTPDLSSFIPADAPPTVTCSAEGNIDKGVLLASFPSGEGASGSAVIHEDKVVAVLFAGDSQDATASRSITTNAFSEWLSGILSERG